MNTKKGKIISVTSTKGGVGKTTITFSLAASFEELNKKVLIIDLDLYSGAVALSLNVFPDKTIYNMVDDLSNNRYKNFKDYIIKYNENIDILSCPKDPRQANKIQSKYVELLLSNALYHYDVILVDMSHLLDKVNVVTLDMADTILYVLTNDPMNIKNAKTFMAIMNDIEKDNIKIVLNNCVDPNKSYFSKFDIKNIIKRNIDYTIDKSFYYHTFDKIILDGNIISVIKKNKKDFSKFSKMAKDLIVEE